MANTNIDTGFCYNKHHFRPFPGYGNVENCDFIPLVKGLLTQMTKPILLIAYSLEGCGQLNCIRTCVCRLALWFDLSSITLHVFTDMF